MPSEFYYDVLPEGFDVHLEKIVGPILEFQISKLPLGVGRIQERICAGQNFSLLAPPLGGSLR